jgi:structure-specific endonuclease subunit SLX1
MLKKMNPPFYVYCLESDRGTTYVGATVNLQRRLRQHNKVIKGGAVITGRMVERGGHWNRVCHVTGFPTWKCALQFEWKWKFLTRKVPKGGTSTQRRLEALNVLIAAGTSTSTAIPFDQYELTVVDS